MNRTNYTLGVSLLGPLGIITLGVILFVISGVRIVRGPANLEQWTRITVANRVSLLLAISVIGTGLWLIWSDRLDDHNFVYQWAGILAGAAAFGMVAAEVLRLFEGGTTVVFDALAISVLGSVAFGLYNAQGESVLPERYREEFTALFNNVPNPTFAVDTSEGENTIVMVNPAFEARFDMSADALRGTPLSALATEEEEQGELPYTTPTDEKWSEKVLTLEVGKERRKFVKLDSPLGQEENTLQANYDVYRNVGEQRLREERLNVLSRTLRHDIRNKMTAIEGNLSVLKESPDHPKRERMFEGMEQAAESILSMSERAYEIEQTLSENRDRTAIHVSKRIIPILEEFRETYPDTEFSLDADVSPVARGTESVPIAIRELLDNAAKHSDADQPHVDVEVVDEPDSGSVHVSVRDNGSSISEEEREVLVGDVERSKLNHLDGLGLWFVNWVVRDSGGSMEIEENEPRGTVVTMTLPRLGPNESATHD